MIVDCNDEAARAFQCDKSEIIGKMCFQFVCTSRQGKCPITDLHQHMDNAEREVVTPKGNRLTIIKTVRNINISGRDYLLETFTDITEKRENEERARGNEIRYRELFDGISSGVAVYEAVDDGADFIFRDFNRAGENIDAVKREDLIGKRVTEVFPTAKEFGLLEVMKRVWETGAPEEFPVTFYEDDRISGWRQSYVYKLPSGEVVAVYDDLTKAKEAERALRDSESKLKLHLEQTMVGAITWDRQFRVTDWNSGAEEIFGYTKEEALGRNGNELLVPEEVQPDIDVVFEELKSKSGGTRSLNENVTKDGRRITCDWYNTTLVDDEGEVLGAASLVINITARVKAQEAFKQSEAFLDSLLEQSPVPTLICDEKGFLVRLNPACRSLMRVKDEEVIGKYNVLRDNIAVEQGYGELVKSVYTEGKTVNLTIHYDTSRMEGVEPSETVCRILDVTVFPIRDDNGRVTYAVVKHVDVTEERKAAEALIESEQKFRALFEGAAEGILVADAETREFSYANPAICELLGYSEDEIRRLGVAVIHPEDKLDEVFEVFEAQARGEIELAPELPCLRKDGKVVYCDINTSRVSIGNRDCLVGFFNDVTERRAARKRIEETNSRLRDLEEIVNRSPAVAFLWRNEENWPVDYVSDNIRQFGYEPQDLQDGRVLFSTIVHPDDLERIAGEVSEYSSQGMDEFSQEYRILTSGGEVRWVDDRTWIRRNEAGAVTHYQGIMLDITKRKEAEQKLQASHDFLETLLDTIPSPVFYKDENLRYTGCNRAFEEFTSKSRDEIIGKNVYDTAPREIAEKYDQKDRELLKSGGTQQYEWKVQASNSELRDAIFDKAVLNDENGTPKGLVGIITDITGRKRAEEAMRKSEALLNETGQMAKIGGWEHDLETGKATWTDALYDIIEIPPDAKPPGVDDHLNYYPPHDRKVLEEAYWKAVNEGKPFDLELQVYTANRKLLWCRVSGESIVRDGKCLKLKGTFQDITDRKEAELETQRIARFPEENPNPVIRATSDGVMTYANAASKALMERWNCVVGSTLPDEWKVLIHKTHQQNTRTTAEVECNGRTIAFALAPVQEEGYVNMYGMDVTEQRAAEVALRQAQKMEAIGRLASGVAHDFNNILQVILGYSSVASHTTSPGSETAEAVEQIRNACERAVGLVRQLLIFSRKDKTKKVPLDVNAHISGLEKMLRRLLREDIELAFEYGGHTGAIEADPGHIDQILMNLVVNARDAMPDGGSITVRTDRIALGEDKAPEYDELEPGDFVELAVRDTGMGISPEVLDNIFEPFYTTKQAGKGTGLGLATVAAIVKEHRGAVRVETSAGEGTTFRILLPAESQVIGKDETLTEPETEGGDETILVAEDDDILRTATRKILERAGYSVLLAADGQEALDIIEDWGHEIDLALLDVVMPRISGRDVYEKLKALGAGTKVIFSSGYTAGILDMEFMKHERIPLVEKPYSPEHLLLRIRDTLKGSDS